MRLNDICVTTFLCLICEYFQLLGKNITFGEEVKVGDAVLGLHFGNGLIHEIFSGNMKRVWKMVYFLIWKEGMIDVSFDSTRRPINSPIFVVLSLDKFIVTSLNPF